MINDITKRMIRDINLIGAPNIFIILLIVGDKKIRATKKEAIDLLVNK